MKPEDVESLLHGLESPMPPARLEETVLGEARRQLARVTEVDGRSRSGRVWGIVAMAAALLTFALVVWTILPGATPTLPAAPQADEKEIVALVAKFASDDIAAREEAEKKLVGLGKSALPALRRELSKAADKEIQNRLRRIIEQIDLLGRPHFELVKSIELDGGWTPGWAAWSPDGKHIVLAAGAWDGGFARVYETAGWTNVAQFELKGALSRGLAYSRDGKLLMVKDCEGVALHSTDKYERVSALQVGAGGYGVAFLDKGRIMFGAPGNELKIAMRKGDAWPTGDISVPKLFRFDVSPDGRLLAAATMNDGAQILDVESLKPVAQVKIPEEEDEDDGGGMGASAQAGNLAVVFSPNSELLAVEGWGGLISTHRKKDKWTTSKTWKPSGDLTHGGSSPRVGFTRDSRHLLTVGEDKHVRAWSCDGWKEVTSTATDDEGVTVMPSPADDRLIVGCKVASHGFSRLLVFRLVVP